ncbi:MAG TPA: hypothetical protein VJ717_10675 [Gemmatimonadaceae bacterium]|nr:hypothetical protein [Gemmatimonadaceae bacterium]
MAGVELNLPIVNKHYSRAFISRPELGPSSVALYDCDVLRVLEMEETYQLSEGAFESYLMAVLVGPLSARLQSHGWLPRIHARDAEARLVLRAAARYHRLKGQSELVGRGADKVWKKAARFLQTPEIWGKIEAVAEAQRRTGAVSTRRLRSVIARAPLKSPFHTLDVLGTVWAETEVTEYVDEIFTEDDEHIPVMAHEAQDDLHEGIAAEDE